jgi:predicted amidophosphoribosyltransferase
MNTCPECGHKLDAIERECVNCRARFEYHMGRMVFIHADRFKQKEEENGERD